MHLTLTTAISLLAAPSNAYYVKINYYHDNSCTSFASSPPNVPINWVTGWPIRQTFFCYNWQWTGSNSANVANCDGYGSCTCTFYSQPNCTGTSGYAAQPPWGNCAPNPGQGWQSFRCFFTV